MGRVDQGVAGVVQSILLWSSFVSVALLRHCLPLRIHVLTRFEMLILY